MTSRPSGSMALGTHRYRCEGSADTSLTGSSQIALRPIVAYRFSLLCSGAIFPVRLVNCQGGSASIVVNLQAFAVPKLSPISIIPREHIARHHGHESGVPAEMTRFC